MSGMNSHYWNSVVELRQYPNLIPRSSNSSSSSASNTSDNCKDAEKKQKEDDQKFREVYRVPKVP